jgi:hypothetical protein
MKLCLFLKVASGNFVMALSSIDFYGGNIGGKKFFFSFEWTSMVNYHKDLPLASLYQPNCCGYNLQAGNTDRKGKLCTVGLLVQTSSIHLPCFR